MLATVCPGPLACIAVPHLATHSDVDTVRNYRNNHWYYRYILLGSLQSALPSTEARTVSTHLGVGPLIWISGPRQGFGISNLHYQIVLWVHYRYIGDRMQYCADILIVHRGQDR